MVYWIIGILWLLVFALKVLYSARYSYRDVIDRPVGYKGAIGFLRGLEFILYVVLATLLIVRGQYIAAGAFGPASLVISYVARRSGYRSELRRMAATQVEFNHMEWSQATGIAEQMLDMEIKSGRRIP